jgi:NAD(P)-dependent dehydrogenase (short-subunit alcohol dehydrogenase family)
MRGLENKRVVITGGASGIGFSTAVRFLDEGSKVVVLDRDREAREKLATDLPDLTEFIPCDVSDLGQVQNAIDEAIQVMGGIDVLINNAGISIRHDFLDVTREEWEKVIGVNLNGVFYVAQTVARHMLEHDGGVILNMGSTNGIMGYRHYSDYNASKAGVIELTKSMALELAPRVRVNAVAPQDPPQPDRDARGGGCPFRVPGLRGSRVHHGTCLRPGRRRDYRRDLGLMQDELVRIGAAPKGPRVRG